MSSVTTLRAVIVVGDIIDEGSYGMLCRVETMKGDMTSGGGTLEGIGSESGVKIWDLN